MQSPSLSAFIGQFEDVDHVVNYAAADPYAPPYAINVADWGGDFIRTPVVTFNCYNMSVVHKQRFMHDSRVATQGFQPLKKQAV